MERGSLDIDNVLYAFCIKVTVLFKITQTIELEIHHCEHILSCYRSYFGTAGKRLRSSRGFFFFFFSRLSLHTKGYDCCRLLSGIFLAWETRNVTIPALNDSKYIECRFITCSCCPSSAWLTLEGSEYYDASYSISSMCLIMSTSLTMLLAFAPKVRIFCLETPHENKGKHQLWDY